MTKNRARTSHTSVGTFCPTSCQLDDAGAWHWRKDSNLHLRVLRVCRLGPLGTGRVSVICFHDQSNRCGGAYESHERHVRALPLSYGPSVITASGAGGIRTHNLVLKREFVCSCRWIRTSASIRLRFSFEQLDRRSAAHPLAQVAQAIFSLPVVRRLLSQSGRKDSNLYHRLMGRWRTSLYAPAVGRGQVSC